METGLKNKTVLITGASGGIGSEIVRWFDREGANLVLVYHSGEERITKLTKELTSPFLTVKCDLADEKEVENLYQSAEKRFGRIDNLVYCSGVLSRPKSIAERTLEEWESCFRLNSTAAFLAARGFFRNLIRYPGEDAAIVFIGSTAGAIGEADYQDYASTKSAISYGLVKSLRVEIQRYARRGRVNAVNPGWCATPMVEEILKDSQTVHRVTATIPMRKVAQPADVAAAVLFLSSGRLSGHITGETVTVSGGMQGRLLHGELKPTTEELKPY